MKIAAISDDGLSISQHFGRAQYYVIVAVEDGQITASETRPKAGHRTFAGQEPAPLAPGERHGYAPGSQEKHRAMAETIADCEVLIAGGMGWGAYESLKANGIRPIITDLTDIREAVRRYVEGDLPDLMDRLH
jgi:predicted Fe-Mo cluster-binding NifX family protein